MRHIELDRNLRLKIKLVFQQVYWVLGSFFGGEIDMSQKPVAKWTQSEVLGWLDELGPWATNSVAPIFQENDIGWFCFKILFGEVRNSSTVLNTFL